MLPFMQYTLLAKKHKYRDKIFKWSLVEEFRYLEYLYQTDPKLFLSVPKEEFELVKKEFYENQPIILTSPLKKDKLEALSHYFLTAKALKPAYKTRAYTNF
jgi:hypothetical protein